MSDCEKLLFSNGLTFSVLYKTLDYVDYLVYFELFLETFFLMKIRIFLKQKLRKQHYHLIWTYSNNISQNLSKDKLIALQNSVFKNKDLIIEKLDKGNSVLISDRQDYINRNGWCFEWFKQVYQSKFEKLHFIEFCSQTRKTGW